MKKKTVLFVTVVLLLAAAVSANDLVVTVYNSNLGVVSETRSLEFKKGIGRLPFRDVPAYIDAASVRFEIAESDKNVSILEQNYAFDLVSPEKLYAKYIDHEIELIDKEGRLYTGTLLAPSGNSVTMMDELGKVKIISLKEVTEVNFPVLPDGLITRPTLFWLYHSDYSGTIDCNVGYQTSGMNWTAEYVGLLDESETELSLSGWASIDNTSGKTYKDAKLKLIAGDIHRAPVPGRGPRMEQMLMAKGMGGESFEEKAFFEYHMYTLPRKTTLADKEIKQVSLFEPAETGIEKVYLYQPDRDGKSVKVKVEFVNSKDAGLGMPLPAGRVRMFKADSDGSLVLLGEDRIDHTPKDEEVSLTVGTAFDIAAEERLAEQTRISKLVENRKYEIELRNRKDEDVIVKVEKKLWGFWEVQECNFDYKQKDANTLVFQIPVKAGETVILELAVRFTSR